MNNENTCIAVIIVASVLGVIVVVAANLIYDASQDTKIAQMVKAGADPVTAMCAIKLNDKGSYFCDKRRLNQ